MMLISVFGSSLGGCGTVVITAASHRADLGSIPQGSKKKKSLVASSLTQVAAAPSPDQSKVQPKKSLHQTLVALNPKSYKTDSLYVTIIMSLGLFRTWMENRR